MVQPSCEKEEKEEVSEGTNEASGFLVVILVSLALRLSPVSAIHSLSLPHLFIVSLLAAVTASQASSKQASRLSE